GRTWSGLDGSGAGRLPDIPAHALAVDPADSPRPFLGTDLGVFVSIDGGAHWDVEDTGFPNVVTEWLVARPGAEGTEIYAFTHGRRGRRAPVPQHEAGVNGERL